MTGRSGSVSSASHIGRRVYSVSPTSRACASASRSGSDTRARQRLAAPSEPAAEDLAEEALLRLEVVVEHPLVDLGLGRDRVDAGAGDALGGELAYGRREDPFLRRFGIAVCHDPSPLLGRLR